VKSFTGQEASDQRRGLTEGAKPPGRPRLPSTSSVIRPVEVAIWDAAKNHKMVMIYYKKESGGTAHYLLEPYSIRYKRDKVGWRKYLFAWGKNAKEAGAEEKVRQFIMKNVLSAMVTDRVYAPRYPVEF
jgi:hypothetical protein